jgi:hypothetical protein
MYCNILLVSSLNRVDVQGCSSSLAVGAGEGQFGIWFDEDLNHGRSQACPTFDNPPLTPAQDFRSVNVFDQITCTQRDERLRER